MNASWYYHHQNAHQEGKKTDYVARQHLGSAGKVDNGIVSVNAYGIYNNITFLLDFKALKPQGTL